MSVLMGHSRTSPCPGMEGTIHSLSKDRSGSTIHSLVCLRIDLEAPFTAWYVQGQIWKHYSHILVCLRRDLEETIHSLVCPRTDLETLFIVWYVQGQIWKHYSWLGMSKDRSGRQHLQLGMFKDRSGRHHSQLGMFKDRSGSTIHRLVCPRTDLETLHGLVCPRSDLEALFTTWYVQGHIWKVPFTAWYVQ